MGSVKTVGNVTTALRNESIGNWTGRIEAMLSMSRNHKWEEGDVDPVTMPEETYGVCIKPRCKREGDLANGLCQKCWDSGSNNKRLRTRKVKADLPIIIIS
jgi:hypothetical protein